MTHELVLLKDVLRLSIDSVPVDSSHTYSIAGVYSFGRGLLSRQPILGSETTYKTLNRLHRDDFVLSQLKGWEGALAKVTAPYDGWFLSPQFPTFRAISDKLDISYLDWYCKRSTVWEELRSTARGMGARRDSVSPDRFLSLRIPLPPLPEQRRIVARIEELAAKINEARGLRQKAAEEAEAFVTSFHAKLAGARMKKLGDILRLDEDLATVTPTGSYPQVGVKSFGGGLFAKSAVTGSETTYKTFNRLYEGALVLSQVKGWEGAVAICPVKLAGWLVSPEYRTFRCVENQARPSYLAPLVRTQWFWEKLGPATRGVGARRERTRPEQFLNIEIPMPTVEKQAHGERVFARVDALKKFQTDAAAELDALMPSILDKAFKGEL